MNCDFLSFFLDSVAHRLLKGQSDLGRGASIPPRMIDAGQTRSSLGESEKLLRNLKQIREGEKGVQK